ncbi:hypothetical protein HI914_06427 [Erysiphe necator]|nr:hypothetical protein HI914_06427 [Erysiphe necator]
MRVVSGSTFIFFFLSSLSSIRGTPLRGAETSSITSTSDISNSRTESLKLVPKSVEHGNMRPKIMVQPPRDFRLLSVYHSTEKTARDNIPAPGTLDFRYLTSGAKGAARHMDTPRSD